MIRFDCKNPFLQSQESGDRGQESVKTKSYEDTFCRVASFPDFLQGNLIMKKSALSRTIWALTLTLLLALACAVLFYTAGPAVIERIIISQMRSSGLEEPKLKVHAVTHNSLHLTGVSASRPLVHIDSVVIDFSLGGLIRGRVNKISISGLKQWIAIRDNKLDLGLPDTNQGAGTPPVIPADVISINSSAVIINYSDKDYLVPFSSLINVYEDYGATISAWIRLLGQPVSVKGESNLQTMETRVQVQALWSEFLGPGSAFMGWGKKPVHDSGLFQASLNMEWVVDSQGRGYGDAELNALVSDWLLERFGLSLGLRQGRLHLRAGFNDEFYFDRFETRLHMAGLHINDNNLQSLDLSLKEAGALLDFSAATSHPFSAEIAVRGKQSCINSLLENGLEYEADLDWSAGFEMDIDQAEILTPLTVKLDRPVKARAVGSLSAGFLPDDPDRYSGWFVNIKGDDLDLNPVSVSLDDYGVDLKELMFKGPFFLEAGPDVFKAGLGREVRLSSKEVSLKHGFERFFVRGLDVKNQPGRYFSEFTTLDNGARQLSFGVQAGGFDAGNDDILIKGRDMQFTGKLQLDQNGLSHADIRLKSAMDLIASDSLGVRIADVWLDVPFVIGDQGADSGRFSSGPIAYSGISLPGIAGQVMIDNYKILTTGQWPFLPGADMDFAARILSSPDSKISGRVEARSEWFELPEKQVIAALAPPLADMDISGSVRAELSLVLDGAEIIPMVRVDFQDVQVADADMDLDVSGVDGSVVINEFFPLTTPGNQRIEVKRLKIGELILVDGFATFRLESPDSVFLERTKWHLPEGGFIAAHASRIDLQQNTADLEIFIEDVDFLQLVSRISQEKIVGRGRVYGRVPLVYRDERVSIGQGYLYSVPGVGRLGIRDEEWLEALLAYVRQAMAGHPYLSTVSERLEQALSDFEYNFLSVNLDPEAAGTSARIELRGRGVQGDPPQEVGSLVVNVNDLEEIVNRVLRFQLTKDESIERALDDFFDFGL